MILENCLLSAAAVEISSVVRVDTCKLSRQGGGRERKLSGWEMAAAQREERNDVTRY